jgi:hypothetical protein
MFDVRSCGLVGLKSCLDSSSNKPANHRRNGAILLPGELAQLGRLLSGKIYGDRYGSSMLCHEQLQRFAEEPKKFGEILKRTV